MNSRPSSLSAQLSFTYGLSVILVLAIFTSAILLIAAELSGVVRDRIMRVYTSSDAVLASQLPRYPRIIDAAPSIAAMLRTPGTDIAVFDFEHRRIFVAGHVVELNHHAFPGGSSRPRLFGQPFPQDEMHPPNPNHFALLGMILDTRPVDRSFPGGRLVIFPNFENLGMPLLVFGLEFAALVVGALALAASIGKAVTRRAIAPLEHVTKALLALAEGDFASPPIPQAHGKEIGELTLAYNKAVARIEAAFTERDVSELRMRQFIADAGHELRTPLTVILGYIDVLKRQLPPETRNLEKIFTTIDVQSVRMRSLVHNLMLLMRLDQEIERPQRIIDLTALVQDVVETMRPLDPGGRVGTAYSDEPQICGDIDELREAVTNVLDNALKYAPEGPINVAVRQYGAWAYLEIRDHGTGIASEDLSHIFERFYRGTQSAHSEGSGLGLAITRRAVGRAGGSIEVTVDGGTVFSLRFPLAYRQATPSAPVPYAAADHER